MTFRLPHFRYALAAIAFAWALGASAQTPNAQPQPDDGPPMDDGFPPPDGPPGFDGPPPFGPGGFGPGGPGPGGMMQEIKLVKEFDKNGDGWLNAEERKAAREELTKRASNRGPGGRRGRFGGPGGFGRPGEDQEPPKPGPNLSPADVKSFPGTPLYGSNVLRTLFLEFEGADWEKELADFKNTDVEVPAKLTVDGKTYKDVGVHFHGMSSFMMVGEGRKRSLVLSLDFIHQDQQLGGYRKLNLLNSHEDPSFLRTVLSLQIARDYIPAPKANFVRVVINGESWGVYVNQQHFNKEFVKEWFGTTKGARWKVPGSPNGRGGMNYLGDNPDAYKRIYELKSKDDAKSWADLIHLCKVLDETPANQLEKALAPLLDIDGALKFFAWENVLANGDGFWTRASDFDLYEDQQGRFHVIPYDANETFSMGGGPGGPGGPRGFGGPGGFGPGMFVAAQIFTQADRNDDKMLTREEFTALADTWFTRLDPDNTGKLNQDQFTAKIGEVLPAPQGRGGFGPQGGGPQRMQGPGAGRRGFGPAMFIGPGLFTVADGDKDGWLTRAELKDRFDKWFIEWDTEKKGALNEEMVRNGFNSALPRPQFGGPGGGFTGPDGRRGRGGPGFGPGGGGGAKLDPLVAADDPNKPFISKLMAVPSLRARYLGYVRDIAERWLDWNKLGTVAAEYHGLIAGDVKTDTRKLDSLEEFQSSLEGAPSGGTRGPGGGSLRGFAEQRRAYLLSNPEVQKAGISVLKAEK